MLLSANTIFLLFCLLQPSPASTEPARAQKRRSFTGTLLRVERDLFRSHSQETEVGWLKRNLCQAFSKCWINVTTVVPNPFANTAVLCFLFQLTSKDSEVLERFDLALWRHLHPESSSEPTWQCHSQPHSLSAIAFLHTGGWTRGLFKQHFRDP